MGFYNSAVEYKAENFGAVGSNPTKSINERNQSTNITINSKKFFQNQ